MRRRSVDAAGAGCLLAFLGACVGCGVWLSGARAGLGGGFEGEREWSLLYVELPVMMLGVPALTLASWASVRAVMGGRGGRRVRVAVSVGTAVAALVVLGLACLAWWAARDAGRTPI
ncbi:hypothetical protein AB0B79_39930 [Streptomyces sp. NPDC039022]|uniref:hypothetical protein n=1 Tax=unclassified Streptomyces TaxID=2593676 RepID=UPI00340BEF60